jgi:hypothetical protein
MVGRERLPRFMEKVTMVLSAIWLLLIDDSTGGNLWLTCAHSGVVSGTRRISLPVRFAMYLARLQLVAGTTPGRETTRRRTRSGPHSVSLASFTQSIAHDAKTHSVHVVRTDRRVAYYRMEHRRAEF